jgi:hypothetical protein
VIPEPGGPCYRLRMVRPNSTGASIVRPLSLAGVAISGCLVGSNSVYPLYPDPENKRSSEEVATLLGDVAKVDGQDVSEHGAAFELLPGCHIVAPPEKWGKTDYNNTVWADVGQVDFAIDMKAQHRYIVRIDVSELRGTGGSLSIKAWEEDMDGTMTRSFEPSGGPASNAECRSQAPEAR